MCVCVVRAHHSAFYEQSLFFSRIQFTCTQRYTCTNAYVSAHAQYFFFSVNQLALIALLTFVVAHLNLHIHILTYIYNVYLHSYTDIYYPFCCLKLCVSSIGPEKLGDIVDPSCAAPAAYTALGVLTVCLSVAASVRDP